MGEIAETIRPNAAPAPPIKTKVRLLFKKDKKEGCFLSHHTTAAEREEEKQNHKTSLRSRKCGLRAVGRF